MYFPDFRDSALLDLSRTWYKSVDGLLMMPLQACSTLYRVKDRCTIDYFKMKCPTPLANRDMVFQVSWKKDGDVIWVWQSSVAVKSMPPEKKTVRAYVRLAGYRFEPTADGKHCNYTFISHSNPGGKIPKFLVNFTTSTFAPGFIKTFVKACVDYPAWKAQQTNPDFMPWLNPNQHDCPFVSEPYCIP